MRLSGQQRELLNENTQENLSETVGDNIIVLISINAQLAHGRTCEFMVELNGRILRFKGNSTYSISKMARPPFRLLLSSTSYCV